MGRANEVSEGRVVTVEGKWHFYIRLVLKGCPNLGPPLPHPLSMVQGKCHFLPGEGALEIFQVL